MKVVLDKGLCAAHGDCVVAAPEVFDIGDDDDTAVVLDENPGEDQRPAVEMAVRVCPVSALRIGD
ncbi:ferredoxin [Amycolatopsis acidicola]|uniref:Ferredoxin n=1 Tax=Amycolatopsis acidicola TaxID=2596893 RepID=A0A5N0V3B8_9PSEU|nr:ferredoxin [Amycolatopsis acidicola]KAA9160475.1 ferredoxin [Amycolatopsis acidicola]